MTGGPGGPGGPDPARVFVALALGPELGARAGAAAEAALAGGGWRLARPDGLHATLFFLGATPRERLAPLGAVLAAALAPLGAPGLRLSGSGAFPDARRPRVLWLGVRESGPPGRLAAARDAVLAALAGAGVDTAAEAARPFTPHVTVARPVRDGGRGGRGGRGPGVPEAFRALDLDAPWTPREAVLMESLGGPDGSRYVPVARFPFRAESA